MRLSIVVGVLGAVMLAGCGRHVREPGYRRVVVRQVEVVPEREIAVIETPGELVMPLSDDEIEEVVERELRLAPDIDARDIDVDVDDGEVTLEGEVATFRDRERAQQIALGVPGVRRVFIDLDID
jgi:osmotically-inducible protein OsmY